jgi:hypothetical protein
MDNPSLLPSTQRALEALYQLAAGISQEICTFQPELLVSLAHSDLGPLHTAQVYWGQTQQRSFPPFVRINLGVEKQHIYETWRLANGMDGFDVNYTSTPDFHHYQVWFHENKPYQSQFRMMLEGTATANFQPKRVLILDEISHGNTRAIAFGLLSGLYPDAELRFIAGVQDWTNALGEAWLNAFYPALWQELQTKKTSDNLKHRFPTELHALLKQVVVGTEDAGADSLAFQPIQESSSVIQKLAEQGINMQDSLACSRWVCNQITDYVFRRLSDQLPPEGCEDHNEPWVESWPMQAKEKIWIEIWTQNGVSLSRWVKLAGITRTQARHEIRKQWQFYQNLQPAGFGARTRYCVDARFLPEPTEEKAQTMSLFLALQGGRILAQGYPGMQFSLEKIIEDQIDWILDLTTAPSAPESEHYFPNRNPDWFHTSYQDWLQEMATKAGWQITIRNLPIEPYTAPTVEQMASILDAVDQGIAEGKKILLHDLRGNERAGLVLACYLIRHGQLPREALRWLNRELQNTLIKGYRIPGTEGQHRFALAWKVGQ